MTTTTTRHWTAVRREHGSAYGRGNVTVLCTVTCEVCGHTGSFGSHDAQVAELVELWDWHGDCRRHRDAGTLRLTNVERNAARGVLDSLDHYGNCTPAVSDGRMATPAYYANRLNKVLHSRGDTLPGSKNDWILFRWQEYARRILAAEARAFGTQS